MQQLRAATKLPSEIRFLNALGEWNAARRTRNVEAQRTHWSFMKKAGVFTVTTAAAWYLLLAPAVAMPFYNFFLFHPYAVNAQLPAEIDSFPLTEVCVKEGKDTLHGLYVRNPNAKKTVLISHGNGGNVMHMISLMQIFVRAGFSVMAYDYRGFGKSSGEPSLDGIVDDGLAAYDFLVKEKSVTPNSIVLAGQSLGTGVTCQIAKKRETCGLILISAFTDLIRAGRENLGILNLYPDFAFPRQTLDTAAVLSKTHLPTLIIHGEKDPLISVEHAKTLSSKTPGNADLLLIPGGDHNNLVTVAPLSILEKVKRFL